MGGEFANKDEFVNRKMSKSSVLIAIKMSDWLN